MSQTGSPATHSTTLAFINVTHPSGLKRHSTEIRKHVMRDIGRARRRPRAQDSRRLQNKRATVPNVEELSSNAVLSRSNSNVQAAEKQIVQHVAQVAARYSPLDETNLHSFLYPRETEESERQLIRNSALDISPRFPLSQDMVLRPADQGVVNRDGILYSSLQQLRAISSSFEETIDALELVAGVSAFINNNADDERFWDNDIQTARLIINSAHKVLSLPRVDPEIIHLHALFTPDIIIREVLRRSLLVFVALLKVRSRFTHAPLELSKHLSALKDLVSLPTVDWSPILELKLWALFICSLAIDPLSEDKEWRVGHIRGKMAKLQLDNSDGVLKVVKEIIWIEDLVPTDDLRRLCAEIDGGIYN
ncbi:hypothetical protein ABW21_db0207075 [Orbilia brochopaga]|nr:hypothetical protein ABW21_db0207075 [Drechslerella brochopaga]